MMLLKKNSIIVVGLFSVLILGVAYNLLQPKAITEITSTSVEVENIPSKASFLSMSEEELCENLIRYGLELPTDYANNQKELAEPFVFSYFPNIASGEMTEEDVNNWVKSVNSDQSQTMMSNLFTAMNQLGLVPISL